MKQTTRIIQVIIGFFLLVAVACNKNLETTPDTSLVELKTFDDVRSALWWLYDGFYSAK